MKKTKVLLACVILLGFHVLVTEAGKIHDAIRDGNLPKVKELIENDPKLINAKDDDFNTPLYLASKGGHKEIVKFLITKDADVNVKNKDGWTPLHVATLLGYNEIVKFLIEAHSDVNVVDNDLSTPLHLACQSGHKKIVILLITNGADVKAQDKDNWTPLQYAIAYDRNEISNFLSPPSQEAKRLAFYTIHELHKYYVSDVIGPEEKYLIVPIFYGTDRQKTGEEDPNNYYGDEPGPFEYGTCNVSIPTKHVMGEIERPGGISKLFKENPEKHVVLMKPITPMQGTDFFSLLHEAINKSTERDAFVFVHGFNTTFADAARRTAQLAYDLGFEGAPIMYSWPSNEKVLGYVRDSETVSFTWKNLQSFLNQIVSHTKATNIHLIAHSMGNVLLTRALESLRQSAEKPLFNQVILAAPDIDAGYFKEYIVPAIKGTSRRITLYASSADRALAASKMLRTGYSRAGESGDDIVVVNGIDTIDASEVNTDFLGHGYFAETMPLINDIFHLLRNDLPPDKRNLRPREKDLVRYWSFPKTK